jgi:hypothetical protein
MMRSMSDLATGSGAGVIQGDAAGPVELTFLIADVRGYTSFTRERGDAEAARLARRFAELTRDAVEARSGRVTELRGDEVLAVFGSPDQAVRAAVELQAVCEEEVAADPTLPLRVGVGIDVGEAVPVEDGFRGSGRPLMLPADVRQRLRIGDSRPASAIPPGCRARTTSRRRSSAVPLRPKAGGRCVRRCAAFAGRRRVRHESRRRPAAV